MIPRMGTQGVRASDGGAGWRGQVPPHTLSYDRYEQVYGITTADGRSLTFWETDEDDTLLRFALQEGAVTPAEVRAEAVAILGDRSLPAEVRARAARDLGIAEDRPTAEEPRDPAATSALCAALTDEDEVVAAAVAALTIIRDPRAADALLELAASGRNRTDALEALTALGDVRAVTLLTEVARARVDEWRATTAALEQLQHSGVQDGGLRYGRRAAVARAVAELERCRALLRTLGDPGVAALAAIDAYQTDVTS
jgi:hypothetical protein